MGILDKFKDMLGSGGGTLLDVSKRFVMDRHSFSGTMSKFQVATEISTNKKFGIKFLDAEQLATFRARFKGLKKPEEAEIAMAINHPRIVKTYEFGKTTRGIEYILMEYVPGTGLNNLIRNQHPGVVKNRMTLIRQIAECIQFVHDSGYIHRDICPRNFIVAENCESLKMIDFGLTVPDEEPYHRPGNRTGTPQYMAPEIVRRRDTDRRVDVFSFGVTIYKLLTFEHPWDSKDTTGLAALNHDRRPATDIREHRPDINEKLALVVHKCIEVNPKDRLKSCKKFLSLVRDIKSDVAS